MKTIQILAPVLLLLASEAFCQSSSDVLQIHIVEPQLQTKADSLTMHFSVEVANRTDAAQLLYGFKDLQVPISEEDCSEEFTAGIEVFLLKEDGQRQYGTISFTHSIEETVDSTDSINNSFSNGLNQGSDTVLLSAGSKKIIELCFEARYNPSTNIYYELAPGKYQLYLLYRTGKYLTNLVPEEVIEADREKYNAQVFQGCIKSNIVPLIVK